MDKWMDNFPRPAGHEIVAFVPSLTTRKACVQRSGTDRDNGSLAQGNDQIIAMGVGRAHQSRAHWVLRARDPVLLSG
jgi:hypothetical protein